MLISQNISQLVHVKPAWRAERRNPPGEFAHRLTRRLTPLGSPSVIDDHRLSITARQFKQQKRSHGHSLNRSWIDDARLAGAMFLFDVRVAVEEKVECVRVFEIVQ